MIFCARFTNWFFIYLTLTQASEQTKMTNLTMIDNRPIDPFISTRGELVKENHLSTIYTTL